MTILRVEAGGTPPPAPPVAAAVPWRETILRATGLAAEQLLQRELGAPGIQAALRLLGEATRVSRVYVFQYQLANDNRRCCSQVFEWCADGVAPQIDHPLLQSIDMDACGYARWLDELMANRPVYGCVADFPPAEQALLQGQGILSLVVMPIRTLNRLWGFIGFDDCTTAQPWTADVVACLGVTARVFAAALDRGEIKDQHASVLHDYEELLENVNDVVFRADMEGRWTFLSRAWRTVTGWAVADSLGRSWSEHLEEAGAERLRQRVLALGVDPETDGRCELRLRCADGAERWVLFNVRRIPAGVAGTITDIHDTKLAQAVIEQARLAAEAVSRAKTEFLSTMSHELRTPLNAVIGLADSLLEASPPADPARTQRYLELIRRSGRQLLALINDIMELARLDAGRTKLEPIPLGVDRLCHAVVETVREDAVARGLHLAVEVPAEPLGVLGDERMLRTVLHHLMANAIKFTPRGGRVALRAEAAPGGRVLLSVQDTGMGIGADRQHLLFKPFSQIDSSLARSFPGSGLGLTLVDRIVRLHHGQVSCDSCPGEGSTFRVELPQHGATSP